MILKTFLRQEILKNPFGCIHKLRHQSGGRVYPKIDVSKIRGGGGPNYRRQLIESYFK